MVKDLHARVQDEPRHGCIGELRWHRRALRTGKPGLAQAADTVGPHAVSVIELTQRLAGRARIAERRHVRRRAAEVGPVHFGEAHDQVSQPPGDGGHRRRVLRLTDIPGELTRPQ